VHSIHEHGEIFSEDYLPEGTAIHAMVNGALAQQIDKLLMSRE
jgi:GTP-binding protein HflX